MLQKPSVQSASLAVIIVILVVSLLLYSVNHESYFRVPEAFSSPNKPPTAGQVPPPPSPNRKLHLLLPINSAAANQVAFCRTLFSTLVHGYEPIIFNWNATGDKFDLQRFKVSGVYEYVMNHTKVETDLVFMMDALDIWLQLSPATLIQRYEEMDTTNVVIGADKTCWPNNWATPVCQQMPDSPLPKGIYGPGDDNIGTTKTRPRFACSGTVIGSVAAMRLVYRDLIEALSHSKDIGDQGIFNEFLFARRVSADYQSRLFWATSVAGIAREQNHFINSPHVLDPYVPHGLYPPMLYHGPTGEIPVAVHFNDPDKDMMDEWWGKFWWNQWHVEDDSRFKLIVNNRVEGAEVTILGVGRVPWKKICPDFGM